MNAELLDMEQECILLDTYTRQDRTRGQEVQEVTRGYKRLGLGDLFTNGNCDNV
jgi:hypothetical protein